MTPVGHKPTKLSQGCAFTPWSRASHAWRPVCAWTIVHDRLLKRGTLLQQVPENNLLCSRSNQFANPSRHHNATQLVCTALTAKSGVWCRIVAYLGCTTQVINTLRHHHTNSYDKELRLLECSESISAGLDVGQLLEICRLELPLKDTHICTIDLLTSSLTNSCHSILQHPSQQYLQSDNIAVAHCAPGKHMEVTRHQPPGHCTLVLCTLSFCAHMVVKQGETRQHNGALRKCH